MKCPKCQFDNPEGFKFCGECGHNLALPSEETHKGLSFEEKLKKIQRYLPEGLAEKILSQRDRIEGEHKQVTVMFCDMEGFTPLTEKLGSEKAYNILDQVFEILIHKVHDYDGTVNEMTGDGIMALFGAPIALEDAPQRAIRSALAVHREMGKFSDRLKHDREGIPSLKMRIGIHTGPVVVGTIGNDLRVEFTAVGDTVNLASRMEGLAEPGTTYVTEDIYKITEGLFRFEALGEKEVKGKKNPVKVFRVIAPSTRRTRFDVSAERGLTPFVGRERELELLLDGFQRAKLGKGQAFSIISEAGVGKSRLLFEFRNAIANEDVTFLEGKCLSYSRGVAYHPVIDMLKSTFEILESDGDSEIREKVQRALKTLGADEAFTLPYLLELLSVKDSGIDKIPMSPEGTKDCIIESLKRIFFKGSEMRSLIIAIEDLHWIDKSSEEALKNLLDDIWGARILLIFTFRPEFIPTWSGKSYHYQVNLNRLSNQQCLAMGAYFLGTEEFDKELKDFILDKTEGVPLFIEEFLRTLKDLKLIEERDGKYFLTKDSRGVVIPSTIQDIIMARVDTLPWSAKEVLQNASVIERQFSYDLIDRVMSLTEQELKSSLSILKGKELLYERGIFPKSYHIFSHTLTREAVYNSILTGRKKALHEKIGRVIEDLFKENIGEHYGALADHFIESENYEKAAEYSRLASEKAKKSASLLDAITYVKKRVVSLERLSQRRDVQKEIIDARTDLGLHMSQMLYFSEAKEAIVPIIDLALKTGYKRRLSQIYTILGTYYFFIEEDFLKAFKQLEEAMRISEEEKDFASLYLATYWLGIAQSYNCEFDKAFLNIEKTLQFAVTTNRDWLISSRKSSIGYVYYFQGQTDLSYQTSEEAIRMAEAVGDIHSKAIAYASHGSACYGKGLLEEAIQYLLMAADFGERINLYAWNSEVNFTLGEAYFEIGDYQKSKDHYGKAVWILKQHKLFPSWMNLNKIGLASAKVMNNEKDIDLESLYVYVDKNRLKINEGLMRRYISEILLNIDDQHISEAEDWIRKAIEADGKNGMVLRLGKDYTLYSELSKRKGDRSKAKENLNKAIEILRACGADGFLKKALKEQILLS